jgi:predicted AlkP superfamily pyrophosphatase or phosphodiesterase
MKMIKLIPVCWMGLCLAAQGADYVVAISVDGLGSTYLQTMVDAGKLPHFQQLQVDSAGTTNARNDYNITVTLPNHTSMVTSRRIKEAEGHSWANNTDPAKGVTLHSHNGAYVASVFDVAHDHGLKTGMWASKTKFSLFPDSYNDTHGAPDATGVDDGRKKVDYSYIKSSIELTDNFITSMASNPCQFAFVHFAECDSAGHKYGWGSEPYYAALIMLDAQLGRIMELIAADPKLKGKTVLILTADHGGEGKDHFDPTIMLDYTIPFYVWGVGVTAGDLYALNADTRLSPGDGRPDFTVPKQPIRNGEVGNLALSLLGLPPIPGSTIDAKQDLRVSVAVK